MTKEKIFQAPTIPDALPDAFKDAIKAALVNPDTCDATFFDISRQLDEELSKLSIRNPEWKAICKIAVIINNYRQSFSEAYKQFLHPAKSEAQSATTDDEKAVDTFKTPAPMDACETQKADKKIMPATTDATSTKEATEFNRLNNTPNGGLMQQFANLPDEILTLPRFFNATSEDFPNSCFNPDNQKALSELEGKTAIGFDIDGHGRGTDYALFDFHDVLSGNQFINATAEQWFYHIARKFNGYCEVSHNKRSLRIFAIPTAGKFGKIENAVLKFDPDNPDCRLVVSYKHSAKFLVTGIPFKTNSKEIPFGKRVDDALKHILKNIQAAIPTHDTKGISPDATLENSEHAHIPETISTDHDRLNHTAELRNIEDDIADFEAERHAAIEQLKNLSTFDRDTVFNDVIISAAAFAKLFDAKTFSLFKQDVKNFGEKHSDKKVPFADWLAVIKSKAAEISAQRQELLSKRAALKAKINSGNFVTSHDALQKFTIPDGYSISAKFGIEKIDGEKTISVCRRPVIIQEKVINVEDGTTKFTLSHLTRKGKWQTVPATEAATIFDRNKLISLANFDLPVTSSNSTLLVDFLDAFRDVNEPVLSLSRTVPRCGWYHFDGKDFFVDPRRDCVTTDGEQPSRVEVDSGSQFAKSLRTAGSFKKWKEAYLLARQYPVARFIVAASVAAPLLNILGERNFLFYICAPTRAGKTTALYLAASAIGDEKIIRSFDATKNGLVGAAADINDYAFLIDEKQVADNRIKEQFDNLVYSLANGLGRTKLNKDSTLKKLHDWRTIAVMTGETQLLPDNTAGGAFTRLLSIKTTNQILPPDVCKTTRDTVKHNYGFALPRVIDQIFSIGTDNLKSRYETFIDTFAKNYPDVLDEHRRYLAILCLADALLNNAINNGDLSAFAHEMGEAEIVSEYIFPLIPTTAEIDDTTREKDFVRGFIALNQNRFIGGNADIDKIPQIFGKLDDDDGYTYLATKVLQDACTTDGFDYHKLVSDLVADGFFIPSDKTEKDCKTPRPTVLKKIGKANTRCLRIRNKTFKDSEH